MSVFAEVLWYAAADVEQRGVVRHPNKVQNETCAAYALQDAAARATPNRQGLMSFEADAYTILKCGIAIAEKVSEWNDEQPSKAVVAAAMRDAARLAEWAGEHLLRSKR